MPVSSSKLESAPHPSTTLHELVKKQAVRRNSAAFAGDQATIGYDCTMSLTLKKALSASLPWFKADALTSLATCFVHYKIDKGEILLPEGCKFAEVFLIARGVLRLYFTRRDGREFNKNFYAENEMVLPVTAKMESDPSLFGIASLETGVVWRAPINDFRDRLKRHDQWTELQRKALALMLTNKIQREHDLLALNGRQRYQQFLRDHPGLAARIPLSQLATYLGVTDVSLSRIRRSLRKP